MKKNTYIVPTVTEEVVLTEQFLASSGVNSNNGIGYGGVDTEGEKEPSSRHNVWEDFDEEDF